MGQTLPITALGPEGHREPGTKRAPTIPVREVEALVVHRPGYALVRSSTSSSGSRPGVVRLNFVMAKRKTT